MFYLDRPTSEEFYEVYKVKNKQKQLFKLIKFFKGVIPEYSAMAEHLTTGPCLAVEIRYILFYFS